MERETVREYDKHQEIDHPIGFGSKDRRQKYSGESLLSQQTVLFE